MVRCRKTLVLPPVSRRDFGLSHAKDHQVVFGLPSSRGAGEAYPGGLPRPSDGVLRANPRGDGGLQGGRPLLPER